MIKPIVVCCVLLLIQIIDIGLASILKRESEIGCKLPTYPENGRWNLLNGEGRPGEKVDTDSILKYVCNPNYVLSQNNSYVICGKGWSADPLPVCEKLILPVRVRRQAQVQCKLPLHPENGRWNLLSGDGRPGEKVNSNSILKYECNPDYVLSQNNSYVICDKGWSVDPLPTCEKVCPPVYSTETTNIQCFNKRGEGINCTQATDDSYLIYKCIPYHESNGPKKNIYCMNGHWSYPPPICQPICGRKVGDNTISLVNKGTPLKTIKYPWIVALYEDVEGEWDNICGGSIISPRFVLTAAHCVTNNYGQPYPVENYRVAAAKLYNRYLDVRDKEAQYLEIVNIIIHSEFNGETRRYFGDIAILKTKISFELGPLVQPVCFNGISDIYLRAGDLGEIAGWGKTETQEPSDELRFLEIPYKHPSVCNQELPKEWAEKYNLLDKICAGFFQQNISVCKGDSGSGLVFKNPEDNRYYIHGIVSIAPTTDKFCDTQQNSLYTKVSYYSDFIDLQLTKNSGECRLLSYPKNGRWIIEKYPNKVPGDLVSQGELLKVICNEGYTLSSKNDTIDCESATFRLPVCERTCPPLTSTKITTFKCIDKRRNPIDCTKATDGSIVSYECIDFYEQKIGKGSNIVCTNGAWNATALDCQPVCGKEIDVKRGEKHFKYPWVVAVYGKSKTDTDDKFEFLCGGTLISRNLVITGAFCVTDPSGDLKEDWEYKVAAAKYHIDYGDKRDTDAQILRVRNIIKHDSYKGISQNFLGNVAVLITKGYFTLETLIQPACFRFINELYLEPGNQGVVAGWSTKVSNELSKNLVDLQIPYKPQQQCRDELPDEFDENYYFIDKLCAGIYKKNKFVCRGDGGSGLVFKNPKDDRFYLQGIVSLAPLKDGECDPEQNALYTNVSAHYERFLFKIFTDYEESCRLPPYPENGKWIYNEDLSKVPGELVAPVDSLKFQCSAGYSHTFSIEKIQCRDAKLVSKCERVCPSLPSTYNISYSCERNKQTIDCSEATDGTVLHYECPPYYEPKAGQETTITCRNGAWSVANIECQPVCGKRKPEEKLPWVVAVYRDYEFVCGGTLLSQNVILTAAFCVANARGTVLNQKFQVGAGSRFRDYNSDEHRRNESEFLEVEQIIIHPDYKGQTQNYFGNMAVMVTKGLFTITPFIQPACIKDIRQIELVMEKQEALRNPNIKPAVVSGWGTKKNDLLSNQLIDLEIPFRPQQVCLDELPPDFLKRYNSIDKWCAGLYNQHTDQGVCNGDAGSGLYYENNQDKRYYVHGIVSLTPLSENTCDVRQNTLFTKASFAYNFILEQIEKFNQEDCRLPPHPQNGKWVLDSSNDKKAGDIVSTNDVLRIVCDDGYNLISSNETIKCKMSYNLPKCLKTCHQLNFPEKTAVLCKNSRGEETDCIRPVDGTTLVFTCPLGYSALPGTSKKVCQNGVWSNSDSTCIVN